jgi:hypothetical protein
MPATTAQGIELLDLSSRLRTISQWMTFSVNGWPIPDVARAALGIPSTPPGKETIAELQTLRARLLELAKLEPPAGIGWVADPLAQVAETSRLCGEIYDILLAQRSNAATAFRQAAEDYQHCGMSADADKAAQRAAALEDAPSGNLESQIAAAWTLVDSTPRGTLNSALCRIDLGELLLQAGDTYRARDALLQAETDLKALGHVAPPDGAVALIDMMAGMSGSSGSASVQRAGEALKLRLAFHRLYDGLARAFDPADPQVATDYRKKIEQYRLLTPKPFAS